MKKIIASTLFWFLSYIAVMVIGAFAKAYYIMFMIGWNNSFIK